MGSYFYERCRLRRCGPSGLHVCCQIEAGITEAGNLGRDQRQVAPERAPVFGVVLESH